MDTSAIIESEVVSLVGLGAAVAFVWGNAVYLIAVFCIYLSFRVLYLRAKFKKVITDTAQDATVSVWNNITTEMSHLDQASDERD